MDKLLLTEVEIEIPFHDVDSMRVAWHGNYFKYFEIVRSKMLEKIHYDVPQMEESGIAWPVIEVKCRYIQALTYGMKVVVQCWLSEYDHRLKVDYLLSEKGTGRRLAKGYTIQAAVEGSTGELTDTNKLIQHLKPHLP